MRMEKEDEDKEELSKKIFLAPLEFLLIGCSFKREDQEEEEDKKILHTLLEDFYNQDGAEEERGKGR